MRFVAGADEAGRGSLAGPLVVAGVLLDYETLHGHRTRPLALLNDSKQVDAATREELLLTEIPGATTARAGDGVVRLGVTGTTGVLPSEPILINEQ